jgi:hypothetical protein
MQIVVDFSTMEDIDLIERDARDTPVYFPLRVEHDGHSYPDHAWRDFGVVVLGWWAEALLGVLHGGHSTVLEFMDGAREIAVSYDRARGLLLLRPAGIDLSWEVTALELSRALVVAAEQVLQKLASVEMKSGGVNERDMDFLLSAVARLRATAEERTIH